MNEPALFGLLVGYIAGGIAVFIVMSHDKRR